MEPLGTINGQELDLTGVRVERTNIWNCRIKSLAHARVINCDLMGSKFDIDDIKNILGTTLTLDCYTFQGTELSELGFDALLYLLCLTKGNDERRDIIRKMVISPTHLQYFKRAFEVLGRP